MIGESWVEVYEGQRPTSAAAAACAASAAVASKPALVP
jgi:hypothetical protein